MIVYVDVSIGSGTLPTVAEKAVAVMEALPKDFLVCLKFNDIRVQAREGDTPDDLVNRYVTLRELST